MKATEVLNRYANGERDFRRADLRGQSFKGQDLSGADFTGADIRGANFTNAVLAGVNFTRANGGVILYKILLTVICWFLLFGLTAFLNSKLSGILIGVTVFLMFFIAIVFASAYSARSSEYALYKKLSHFGLKDLQKIYGRWLFQRSCIAYLFSFLYGLVHTLAISFLVLILDIILKGFNVSDNIRDLIYPLSVICMITLSLLYIGGWSNNLVAPIESFFGAVNFRGANLTEVDFTHAVLIYPTFTKSNRTRTCWFQVKSFGFNFVSSRSELDKVLLDMKFLKMRLLVEAKGDSKIFDFSDLQGVNLRKANLADASFIGTDLSHSDLQGADLSRAVLKQAQLNGSNLSEATLTGACLEAWNIDHTTNLQNVDCQYVYLLRNQQERRPSSGDFAPGEFTKLFQEALNTVDLIFRNGVDWKAFVAAFKTVQVDNDGTELTIQSIENKGDGVVVVRVSVPEAADKAKIHGEFNQNYDLALKALEAKYHAELKAKDEQITIYREKSADMTEILRLLANRPVNVEVNASAESKAMNDSTDKSQNINITGSNVTGLTINLGAISGSVSNIVNQLPSAPDSAQPGIKELLVELQAAIESDADLPEKGKASALEQVKVLAEVAQTPEQPEKKGLGSQAITFFKNAVSFLPDTAKLAEACTKLLPLITKALGLPF